MLIAFILVLYRLYVGGLRQGIMYFFLYKLFGNVINFLQKCNDFVINTDDSNFLNNK